LARYRHVLTYCTFGTSFSSNYRLIRQGYAIFHAIFGLSDDIFHSTTVQQQHNKNNSTTTIVSTPTMSTSPNTTQSTMASTAAVPLEELAVATVWAVTSGITVKWDSEETTATHSTLYSDAPYSFSAVKADKKEPLIKTFGTLLNCSGGILTIGETRYRIQTRQPNGKLRCCFCILVFKCCFEYENVFYSLVRSRFYSVVDQICILTVPFLFIERRRRVTSIG
jgi:hypothetical protein